MHSVPIIVREPNRDFKRVKKYAEASKKALDEQIQDLELLAEADDHQLTQATKLRRDLDQKVSYVDIPHAVDMALDQKVSYNDIRMTRDDLQRLKNLRDDIQEDIDALSDDVIDALPTETRDFRTLSIRQVKQHIYCSRDVDDDDLELYHWELKTRSHPFQAFRKIDGSIVKGLRSLNPYATSGQVRLVYTDDDGQVISNAISLDNVRRNLTRAAKAASYRYQDNDPTFLEAVDNVWERILGELDASDEQVLNRTAPSSVGFSLRIQPSRDYGRPMRYEVAVPFSLRVFRDRVHKLYARFDTTVDDIRALDVYDDIIPIVEYVDPTIRLDKTGKNDALRKIQHGKNMRLVLPPFQVLRLRGGAPAPGGGSAGAMSRVPTRTQRGSRTQRATLGATQRAKKALSQTASAAPGVLTLASLQTMANAGDILQLTPNNSRKRVPIYFVRYFDGEVEFVGKNGKTKPPVDLKSYKTSGKPWASFQNDDDVVGATLAKSQSLLAAVIASGQPVSAKLSAGLLNLLGLNPTGESDNGESDNDSIASTDSDFSTVSAAVALNRKMLPKLPSNPTVAKLDAYKQDLIAAAKAHNLGTEQVSGVLVLHGIDENGLPLDNLSLESFVNQFVGQQKKMLPKTASKTASSDVPVAKSWPNQNLKKVFKAGEVPESGRSGVSRKYEDGRGYVFLVEPTLQGRVVVVFGGQIKVFETRKDFTSNKKIDGEVISWYQTFNRAKGAITRVQMSPGDVNVEIESAVAARTDGSTPAKTKSLSSKEMDNLAVDMTAAEARYDSEDMAVAVHPDAHLSTSESETEEPMLAPVQRSKPLSQYLSTSESEEEEETPRGDITQMMSSMPAEWSSTEEELEFAESSAGEEEEEVPFEAPMASTLESVEELSRLDFAASSATDTSSETSETPTSSGLDFAESSAVDTSSATDTTSETSGFNYVSSSAVDTTSDTSETPVLPEVTTFSGLDFAESSAVDTSSSGVEFAESSAAETEDDDI